MTYLSFIFTMMAIVFYQYDGIKKAASGNTPVAITAIVTYIAATTTVFWGINEFLIYMRGIM